MHELDLYINKVITKKCPSCGHKKWVIYSASTPSATLAGVCEMVELSRRKVKLSSIKITKVCTNCGRMVTNE